MYYDELKTIIKKVLKGNIDKASLMNYIIDNFDCEKIYNSDDLMVTDIFFSLKHYASGEEDVSEVEWLYFLDCLVGKRKYNMEEKINIIKAI